VLSLSLYLGLSGHPTMARVARKGSTKLFLFEAKGLAGEWRALTELIRVRELVFVQIEEV